LIRVIYLIDTLQSGGAEKSLLEICRRFRDVEPIFVVLYAGDQHLLNAYLDAGIQVHLRDYPKKLSFGLIANDLQDFLEKLQPDIIHASLYKAEMVSRKLKLTAPLVNSLVNNSYHQRRYQNLNLRGKLALFRVQAMDYFTKNKVKVFVANSAYMGKAHQGTLGLKLEQIHVIPRGRDSKIFNNATETQQIHLRQSLGATDKKIFLNVGRLLDRKGQGDLIQAFAKTHQKEPNTILWIAGKGDYLTTLQYLCEELGITEKVKFLGNRDDLPLLLATADFFVFPSHYEGLPGALIEAMFAQIPIIASDIPENRECVNMETAMLHRVMDVDDLAEKMELALKDGKWDDRVAIAYAYALEHFEIAKVAAQYEQLYKLVK
jgi:glycosyltransferase involved in cell wall biosynthesis